ncbi:MAG TPA: aminodeoxychorismate synthase component I [Xanthomonadales bacterium]|nr:aminodeoxychorismate synthase component I [Xanthomonadales bacterium]
MGGSAEGSDYCTQTLAPGHSLDLLSLAESQPVSFPFFLDSAARGPLGEFSLLFFAGHEELIRWQDGRLEGPGEGHSFFSRMAGWYREESLPGDSEDDADRCELPFVGGWFVYLGYEMAGEIESRLNLPANQSALPDAFARRCPGAIIQFHNVGQAGSTGPEFVVVAESPDQLEEILDLIGAHKVTPPEPGAAGIPELQDLESEPEDKFTSGVERVLHYLRAGDVFQVNISRDWTARFSAPPRAGSVYRCLRQHNPAPFAGLMHHGTSTLLSSSPERLVEVRGNDVQTRPIAGTRPRGLSEDQDLALSKELIDNVKERAEHIMLIDLERNDLGRVCRPGSVEVNELMVVESYAHVHHIVSNVRGRLMPEAGPVDVMKAIFPGGTITGCPKVRCMEIIAELEQVGRGFYTGSMGYLGRNGDMDLNILIRSMLLQGDHISFRTGAGIVADSEPDKELQETRDKARGLLLALEHGQAERRGA